MSTNSLSDIDQIAVIGAGDMGAGIAAVAALSGYETYLNDVDDEQLVTAIEEIEWSYSKLAERGEITENRVDAALDNIIATNDLETAVGDADFLTEAIVEKQDIKEDLFRSLDDLSPDEAIISTNTSGLNITQLAECTSRPSQVLGTHWFKPPILMDLVEVIKTEHTDDNCVQVCQSLIEDFGKTPILCRRDIPLFIVNRCLRPYMDTAAWLVYYDVAEVEEIDSAMKHGENFPMGPFELTDYTGGIQIRVESEQDHIEDTRPLSYDTRVCPLIHDLYDKGHYGRKSGKGFYDYSNQDAPEIPEGLGDDFDSTLLWAPVINEAAKMLQHDVASVEDIDTGIRLGGNWPVGPLEKADEIGLQEVTRYCVDYASLHQDYNHFARALPCNLLIETAKSGESFY